MLEIASSYGKKVTSQVSTHHQGLQFMTKTFCSFLQ